MQVLLHVLHEKHLDILSNIVAVTLDDDTTVAASLYYTHRESKWS